MLASQEEREAVGPVRSMAGFALFMMILALLMMTLLGPYVFLHRKQKLDDIETPAENNQRPAAARSGLDGRILAEPTRVFVRQVNP
jgi:hypothetical protein